MSNPLYRAFCRSFQFVAKHASSVLDFSPPSTVTGAGSVKKLPDIIKERGLKRVLVVTDSGLSALGLLNGMLDALTEGGVEFFLYDKTEPNPTINNIEDARTMYSANACNGIIAFGGGSPMDCAKVAAARIAKPNTPVKKMRGYLKIRKKLPPLFAVPTTAGTGSETTLAAVVTDPETHEKYAVTDPAVKPIYAVLDPELTIGLPPHITSTTGMDALTHAVEAYIGRSNTKDTEKYAIEATRLIFSNVQNAYNDGKNAVARENMLTASFYAGIAFTRAYVGYVHAIAHCLGGMYRVPHGLANAVVLPYVLEWYGKSAHKRLAVLSDAAGTSTGCSSDAEKAQAFIAAIKELNRSMNIQDKFDCIRAEDIPEIAKRAMHEGNPYYPVPRIMDKNQCAELVKKIMQ